MLIAFKFNNFASFHKETYIDMRATVYKDHQDHVIRDEKERVVRNLAVYGGNASGKSNLLRAIVVFRDFILRQMMSQGLDVRGKQKKLEESSFCVPLSFYLDGENQNTEWEIEFQHRGYRIRYGYTVGPEKEGEPGVPKQELVVKEEHLIINGKSIFIRDASGITMGKTFQKELGQLTFCAPTYLFLNLLINIRSERLTPALDALVDFVSNKIVYLSFKDEYDWDSWEMKQQTEKFLQDDVAHDMLRDMIRAADVGIEDVICEDHKQYLVVPIRDEFGKNTEYNQLPLELASDGTRQLLRSFYLVYPSLEEGGVILIDYSKNAEHPLLQQWFVDYCHTMTGQAMQIIFTTNDLEKMDSQYFRRDEIALVDKNHAQESTYYTLADLKVPSGSNYRKDYLMGKYGALPILQEINGEEKVDLLG